MGRSDPVDIALVLAVDVSSSVDAGDFQLQMQGIAAALRQNAVLDIIRAGRHQQVALALVQWSTSSSHAITVPWQILSSLGEIEATAHAIESAGRAYRPGGTGMASALAFSTTMLDQFPLGADRKVIDVSGDGIENDHGDVASARALAIERGIVINGLPIVSDSTLLLPYYR
ncbi:MAG: DUF1194 domain-containing protein, partial [Aestuariivirga sp.]